MRAPTRRKVITHEIDALLDCPASGQSPGAPTGKGKPYCEQVVNRNGHQIDERDAFVAKLPVQKRRRRRATQLHGQRTRQEYEDGNGMSDPDVPAEQCKTKDFSKPAN